MAFNNRRICYLFVILCHCLSFCLRLKTKVFHSFSAFYAILATISATISKKGQNFPNIIRYNGLLCLPLPLDLGI